MTWILGSFLVTPCALASCHILISKQEDDSASGHSGRTGVYQEGDHAVRFRQSAENRESCQGHAVDQVVTDELAMGCKR